MVQARLPRPSDATQELLAQSAVFGVLAPPVRTALARAMVRMVVGPAETLVRQGDVSDGLFIVETGRLRVCLHEGDAPEVVIDTIRPGDTAGEMQLIVGGAASATLVAEGRTQVLRLSRRDFRELCTQWPVLLETVAMVAKRRARRQQLLEALPALLGPLDADLLAAIERLASWLTVRQGEVLFSKGDPGDAWYVVASGRLAVVEPARDGAAERLLAEVGRGEAIGELALLTGEARSATVHALRDSELVRFAMDEFAELLATVPQVHQAVLHALARRIVRRESPPRPATSAITLTLLPASPKVPIDAVAARLTAALSRYGSTLQVSSSHLEEMGIGRDAVHGSDTYPAWIRLSAWLETQGAAHRFLVLVADAVPNGWSARTVGHADHVILLADAEAQVRPGHLEQTLLPRVPAHHGPRRLLVLLHRDSSRLPQGTSTWLDARTVDAHFHLRLDRPDDVGRLARLVSGRSISLALSGGGAKGFAQLGVVRAMRELGIPIDGVAGTSSGALSAFLVAAEHTDHEMRRAARRFHEAGPFRGLTLPIFSLKRGDKLTATLIDQGGRTYLEDLWLPLVAVSSNLTRRAVALHTRGPAWEALRASCAVPGVFEPHVLGGELHVDGGLTDNLPVRVARDQLPGRVIAVDVSGMVPLQTLGPYPSPWMALTSRMRRRDDYASHPGVVEVLTQSMLLASRAAAEQMRVEADLWLRPELTGFAMTATGLSDQIIDAGYEHALERLTTFAPTDDAGW